MKFDHPNKKASFELPDKWTIRKVLDYDSASEIAQELGESMYIRLWLALLAVIDPKDWHCKSVPLDIDLEDDHNSEVLEVIKFAGIAGYSARYALEPAEKK